MTVSHTEEILCLTLTSDSRYLITGSKDSSLKMWEGVEKGGKLVQIMAGHSDHVTAVVSALVSSLPGPSSVPTATKNLVVVSGSRDGQLIIWDAQHGCEIHSEGMKRHRGAVTCLKVSTDGSVLVSGSEDGTVSTWNLRLGTSLSSFVVVSPVRQVRTIKYLSIVEFISNYNFNRLRLHRTLPRFGFDFTNNPCQQF